MHNSRDPKEILDEITSPVSAELREMEREFRLLVQSNVPIINNIINHIAVYKGKRLRPILLLLCSGMTGEITDDSIKAAAMVELLHTATLVHDDVIDESDMRRGGLSVNAAWGNKVSILIGDLFFSRVLYRLSQIKNPEVTCLMSMTIKRICEGELIQLRNGHDHAIIDEKVYFSLIAKKTASLLAAACEIGALSANSSNGSRDRENLKSFGERLGIAFQIKDDLMDLTGTQDKLGKPIAKDIIENTVTLPILYGLAHSNNGDHERIRAIIENGIGEDDLDTICRFAEESGGIEYAEQKAKQYTDMALSRLHDYEDSQYKRSLIRLTHFVTDRSY
ncbi:MAG: polyprenyl synthetase family protein [bacterium]|nr:MAG: polyprenyl synthetase family protein [bacterium]